MDNENEKPKKLNKLTVECDVHHLNRDSIEIDYASYVESIKDTEPKGPAGETGEAGKIEEQAIDFSNRIMLALEAKAKSFNTNYSPKKVTVKKLKEIYVSAVSHCSENDSKNLIAFTRINKFLDVISNFKPVDPKRFKITLNDLEFLGLGENEEYLAMAEEDLKEFNLNFNFKTLDELFIEIPKNPLSYEIEY